MALVTGSAASFAALATAIETAAAANGWTLDSGVLSKGGLFVKLVPDTFALQLQAGTGQSGSALTDAAAQAVKLMDFTLVPIGWPVDYEIHALADPDEVYVVVNYNVDRFQHLHFGVSNVPGIGGTGGWFGGSFRADVLRTSTSCKVFMPNGSGQGNIAHAHAIDGFGLGFFFSADTASYPSTFLHCGLEGTGWKTTYGAAAGNLLGPNYAAALLYALPSQSNQATPLLPIHGLVARASQGQTIAASLGHARYCRLDNVVAGEVIEYGPDSWKLYPMHARNDVQRDGIPWSTGAQHSGTYGVAIRYTGP
jgi:hypothetical protein